MISSQQCAEEIMVLNVPKIKQHDTEDDIKLVERIKSTMVLQKKDITFADVCGMETAKRALSFAVLLPEIHPHLFARAHIEPYKGFLFFGQPGTGKSLIVKAIAGESSSTKLFSLSAEDILSKYIREESDSFLRDLFRVAQMEKPSIILIDHLDCLALTSSNEKDDMDIRSIRSTLFEQLDNVTVGVFVIGITNSPEKLINDRKILSCFSEVIYISLPNKTDRLSMLKQRFTEKQFTDEEFDMLATKMRGLSGADIDEIYKNAYYKASYRQRGSSTSKSLISIEDVWECVKKGKRSDPFDKFARYIRAHNGNDVLEPLPEVKLSRMERFLDFLAQLLLQ